MKYIGDEVVPLDSGGVLVGFGLLERLGYIPKLPTKEEWGSWSKEQRDVWVVAMAELTKKVSG